MRNKVTSTNEYLEHYKKHNISPVRQDISDSDLHVSRRTTLYRTLGLLPSFFAGKKVLEVGPGSGHNSIVVASWNPSVYLLVEPNPTGVSHIREVFNKHLEDNLPQIVNTTIEDYVSSEQYDIIICEGMIPGVCNKGQILKKLDSFLKKDGVLIVTCADEISIFFEIIRYFIAFKLTRGMSNFEDKVALSVKAFGSHLDTLPGFGRLKEDWCADCLFGYAHFNYDFSIKKCLEFLINDYYLYHTSPAILTDYRWYKAMPHDPHSFNQHYLDQFDLKKHNLLHYQVKTADRTRDENEELHKYCKGVMELIHECVRNDNDAIDDKIAEICVMMKNNLRNTDQRILAALSDIQTIIMNKNYNYESLRDNYSYFRSSFGRGQQYMSLIKT